MATTIYGKTTYTPAGYSVENGLAVTEFELLGPRFEDAIIAATAAIEKYGDRAVVMRNQYRTEGRERKPRFHGDRLTIEQVKAGVR